MTITFGWWIIPTLITIATLVWALKPESSHYDPLGSALVGLSKLCAATIASLVSWLAWALL